VIERGWHERELRRLLRSHPVTGILGARQTGKTTLALRLGSTARGPVHRFDLEDPRDLDRLTDPMAALAPLRGLVILDEVQRRPDLFPVLRVLADRPRRRCRFLVLGSASPALLRQSSESLAGRVAYHELPGFGLDEVGSGSLDRLWLRGGFPRAFLARGDAASLEWRRGLVRAYLERDLPHLGAPASSETLRRFWTMLAHLHGQVWNSSQMARNFGVSDKTVRGYLDFLASTFMVRLLPPWNENLGKRQVKSPKVFVRDAGLLHALLGIETRRDLLDHPRVGASWEGLAIEEAVRLLRAAPGEFHFWGTHAGAELDLLFVRGRERLGFEIKRSPSPGLTPSMRIALADLRLRRLLVVHSGTRRYPLGARTEAVPLAGLAGAL